MAKALEQCLYFVICMDLIYFNFLNFVFKLPNQEEIEKPDAIMEKQVRYAFLKCTYY